jgi:Protein of unknown function (DUF1573)
MINKTITLVATVAFLASVSCKHKEDFPVTNVDGNNMVIPGGVNAMDDTMKKKLKPEEYPVIKFDATEHDFGTIQEGDKVEHIFKFTNTGKNDLYVIEVHPSCGCTAPEWTKTPVKSGESGEIKIIFNSAHKSGEQNKSISLLTNTMNGNEILTFKANVLGGESPFNKK